MHTKNMLTTNHKPVQGCAVKMNNWTIKIKMTVHIFVIKMVKFDRTLQKPVETDQDETRSIKASYNKGIHTVVIT